MTNNPWIQHCKKHQAQNPGMSWKDCLKEAKHTYKKGGQRGEGIENIIEPIKEFGTTLVTSIIGSPELQEQRTAARIERRAKKEEEKAQRRREKDKRKSDRRKR